MLNILFSNSNPNIHSLHHNHQPQLAPGVLLPLIHLISPLPPYQTISTPLNGISNKANQVILFCFRQTRPCKIQQQSVPGAILIRSWLSQDSNLAKGKLTGR